MHQIKADINTNFKSKRCNSSRHIHQPLKRKVVPPKPSTNDTRLEELIPIPQHLFPSTPFPPQFPHNPPTSGNKYIDLHQPHPHNIQVQHFLPSKRVSGVPHKVPQRANGWHMGRAIWDKAGETGGYERLKSLSSARSGCLSGIFTAAWRTDVTRATGTVALLVFFLLWWLLWETDRGYREWGLTFLSRCPCDLRG